MIGTSDDLQAEVKGSHLAIAKGNLIQNGQIIRELSLIDGSVTADRTSANMRTCDLTLADPDGDLVPIDAGSDLAPFISQIQIFRGAHIPDDVFIEDLDTDAPSWGQGTNNGTITNGSGALILGYGS